MKKSISPSGGRKGDGGLSKIEETYSARGGKGFIFFVPGKK